MSSRNLSLDIVRLTACALVVLMHSPIPGENAYGPFLSALSYFTAPCIGLFFMVSGALLMPVRYDYTTFLKRRFGKVVVPTLFWTIVYVAINTCKSSDGVDLINVFCSIPFSPQGNGVLWFMYTLAGLYLLAPILGAWVEKARKTDLQIVLGLWAITLCYPLIDTWVSVNESTTGILYYFGGYAGYFLLGYYLKRYPDSISLIGAMIVAAAGAITLLLVKRLGIDVDFYRLFWYLSVFVAALCVVIWKTISYSMRNCRLKESRALTYVANLSFGVYLSHILIMRDWLWQIGWIAGISSYVVQTLIVAILTFVLSVMVCAILSRLPGAQWIIGYKYSK